MDRSAEEILRIIKEAIAGGERRSFVRDGNESDPTSSSISDKIKKFNAEIDKSEKTLRDIQKTQVKFGKSMIEGIPVFNKLMKRVNETTKAIEENNAGRSKAYKQSAEAAKEFANSAGVSSKKFKDVTTRIGQVYESAEKISKLSKQREQAEKAAIDAATKAGIKNAKQFKNIAELENAVEQQLAKARKQKKKTSDLESAKEFFGDLKKIPDEIKSEINEAKKILHDESFQKTMERNPKTREMFANLRAKLEGDDVNKIIERLGGLEEMEEHLAGLYDTANIIQQQEKKNARELKEQLRENAKELQKAISAGLGEALAKEARIMMTRQRLTGAPQAYAARVQALTMGMSEQDLLTNVAQNRILYRALAVNEGEGGAGQMLQSGRLNEIRRLSYSMGLTGAEALENISRISRSLRESGLRISQENIASSIDFVSEKFKELGMTQEDLQRSLIDMQREGLMALRLGTGGMAPYEVIQTEIEHRLKLANVLGQETELQKERVRQLSQLAYGDPEKAMTAAIGSGVLGSFIGMNQADVDLLRRGRMFGGANLTEEERRRFAAAEEAQRITLGRRMYQAAESGNIGERMAAYQMAQMAGIDTEEAARAFARFQAMPGAGQDTSTDAIMRMMEQGRLTVTGEPPKEISSAFQKFGEGLDYLGGVMQSSIGSSAGAIVAALGSVIASIGINTFSIVRAIRLNGLGAGFGRGRGLRGGMRNLRRVARQTGARGTAAHMGRKLFSTKGLKGPTMGSLGIGLGAGIANTALDSAVEGTEYEGGAMDRMGGGALTGATYGAFLGPKGAAIGAAIGAALGGLAYLLRDREAENIRGIGGTLGQFGANTALAASLRNERTAQERVLRDRLREAQQSGDMRKVERIRGELELLNAAPDIEARSLAGNMSRLKEIQNKINVAQRGRGLAGTMTAQDRADVNRYTAITNRIQEEITADITDLVDSGEFKRLTADSQIQSMIDVLEGDNIADSEQETVLKELRDWMAMSTKQREEHIEATKEGNEQQVRVSKDIGQMIQTTNLDRKLAGSVAGEYQRMFGPVGGGDE